MTILSVGCSFLCDRGEVRPQVSIISEKLNLELDNKSIPGNGNVHIVYNIMNTILSTPEKYKLVLIGWSNPGRWDFVTAPHKWFAIKMANVIPTATNKSININDTLFRHWAPQVILLSHWLRSQNIPFVMWNSLNTWNDGNSSLHTEIKNIKEFYLPTECHIDDLRMKKEYISEKDHHPNQKSHNDWADNIIKFYRKTHEHYI
jgi:hypothetical protein